MTSHCVFILRSLYNASKRKVCKKKCLIFFRAQTRLSDHFESKYVYKFATQICGPDCRYQQSMVSCLHNETEESLLCTRRKLIMAKANTCSKLATATDHAAPLRQK